MSDNPLIENLATLIRKPRMIIPGIADLGCSWFATRRWLPILGLAPVVAILLGSVVFAVLLRFQHRGVLAAPFIKKLDQEMPLAGLFQQLVESRLVKFPISVQNDSQSKSSSLSVEELDRMRLLVQHASRLDPNNYSVQFRAAILHDLNGRESEAAEIMDRLAPEESIRFVPAHAWKALQLLTSSPPSEIALVKLDIHLKAASEWSGSDYRIYDEASRICESEGQPRMAYDLALVASKLNPALNLRLADLASDLGPSKKTERKDALDRANRYFSEHLKNDTDQTNARIGVAECELRADHPIEALATLRAGLDLVNCDKSRIRSALSKMLLGLHKKQVKQSSNLSSLDPKHLDEAATMDPLNPILAEEVAFLLLHQNKLPESSPARQALKQIMAEGKGTARTHCLLGQVYLKKNLFAKAVDQFKSSLEKNDQDVEAMIGLARASIQVAPPNTDLANQMVEKAIQLNGKSSAFWALRGDIAFASGDLPKAVESWKEALKGDDTNMAHHRNLYETYRKMGLRDEAEVHRKYLAESKEGDLAPGLTRSK